MLPGAEEGPRIHFKRRGVQLGVQPPIVGDYCLRPSCNPVHCDAIGHDCPRCKGQFCRQHFIVHLNRLVVPRDSWLPVLKRMHAQQAAFVTRHGSEAYRALPFVMGSFCRTPTGRRTTTPCGYESKGCTTVERSCVRCKFPYCQRHFDSHVVRFVLPRRPLQEVHAQYRKQLDELLERRRTKIRIRVPKDWT